MITQRQIKLIKSLEQKKERQKHALFVAEGDKTIAELLPFLSCQHLFISPDSTLAYHNHTIPHVTPITHTELRKISFLQHPQHSLALFRTPLYALDAINPHKELVLALDGIQDPGNLGTIIRIANWFGIQHIVCSTDTADGFAPKVIQASMGAIAQVHIHYTDIEKWIYNLKNSVPIYGTFLHGENIYNTSLSAQGVIVLGNEGKGIRPNITNLVSHHIHIPPFSQNSNQVESLNVAIATGIVCSEFRRRNLSQTAQV